MCSPAVVPLITTAFGAVSQASAQKKSGEANAQIAAANAKVASAQEDSAYEKGAAQEVQYSNQLKELQGKAVAAAGAGGIDPNRGSPLDLLVQSTGFGERDIRQIGINASMEAFGYDVQAINFSNQGQLDTLEGNSQANATLLTGAGNALGGFGKLYDPGGGSSSVGDSAKSAFGG
jgi:hypothetical protein